MSVDLARVEGAALTAVHFDLALASITLELDGGGLVFEKVRASTLLSPWDGTHGIVEWLRLVHEGGGELCYELRVQFEEVPRMYRIVCRSLRASS